jgi:hypothetical protein
VRDRVCLAVTGLVLLAAGGAVVAAGLGALGGEAAARAPVLGTMSGWAAAHRWFWPSATAASCAVALLGFGWLTAQVRGRVLRRLAMGDTGPATRMAVRVAVRAITADVTSYPGVRHVRATLCGSGRRPRIRLSVTCDDLTELGELARRIHDDAMVRLRLTLDRADLRGVVDVRVAPRPARRPRSGA